jgi:hypothetical protein
MTTRHRWTISITSDAAAVLKEPHAIACNDRFADRRNNRFVVAWRVRPAAYGRAMVVGWP